MSLVLVKLITAKHVLIQQEILIKTALVKLDFMMTEMKSANLVPLSARNVVDLLIIVQLALILIELMTLIVIVKMGS